MSDAVLDDVVKTLQNAVDLLASKGKDAEGIAKYLESEESLGSDYADDCPVYNWLDRQISQENTPYVFRVGHLGDGLTGIAVRVFEGDPWDDAPERAVIALPSHLLQFVADHDSGHTGLYRPGRRDR